MSINEITAFASAFGNVVQPIAEARANSQQQSQQADVYRANARIAAYNADMSRANAAQEASAEATRQEQLRAQLRRELGVSRATRGASGVVIDDGGSVQDVYADQLSQGELGLALSRYESLTKQRAYNQQAGSFDFESRMGQNLANMAKSNARRSINQGFFSAAGKLPGVFTQVSSALNTKKILTPSQEADAIKGGWKR